MKSFLWTRKAVAQLIDRIHRSKKVKSWIEDLPELNPDEMLNAA